MCYSAVRWGMREICVNAKGPFTIAIPVFFSLRFLSLFQNPGYSQDKPNLEPLHPVCAGSPSRLLDSAIPSLPACEELSLRKVKITHPDLKIELVKGQNVIFTEII